MRNRGLWDSYVEGIIDFCNHGHRNPGGVPETGMNTGRDDRYAAQHQGFFDAQDHRVLSRTQFTREKVLRRVEVRESKVTS